MEVPRAAVARFADEVWGEDTGDTIQDRWWMNGHPELAIAAVDGQTGDIAGICVAVPSAWYLCGVTVSAVSICGWFVSPRYQGLGLGKSLVGSFSDVAPCMNAFSISEAAIQNFRKLGWIGPFSSWLRVLPFPLMRRFVLRRRRRTTNLNSRNYCAGAGNLPAELSDALDQIDTNKPDAVFRHKRRASDWNFHFACRPERWFDFRVVYRDSNPIGYFALRRADHHAARAYRRLRLHYVTDLVLNTTDDDAIRFLFDELAAAGAAHGAGALLLCTTSSVIAQGAIASGWLSEGTPLVGSTLARKAPLHMQGEGFTELHASIDRIHLTFADSDMDFNI